MREDFSSAHKLEKVFDQKTEALHLPENTDERKKSAGQEITAPAQIQERITAIDAKRENELTQLNATRRTLGLPPTDTSVAVTHLDRERDKLIAQQGRNTTAGDEQATGNLIPDLEEDARVTPEIRHYFTETLGPLDTARRMKEMEPALVPKIRDLIKKGNLPGLVHIFSLYDEDLRKKMRDLNDETFQLHKNAVFDAVDRSQRAIRQGWVPESNSDSD